MTPDPKPICTWGRCGWLWRPKGSPKGLKKGNWRGARTRFSERIVTTAGLARSMTSAYEYWGGAELFAAGTLLAAGAAGGGGLFFTCCSFWQLASVKTINVNAKKQPGFDFALKHNAFMFATP